MNGISRTAWMVAILVSVAVHAALALSFDVPKSGLTEQSAGAPVSVAGSLESVLGGAVSTTETARDVVRPIQKAKTVSRTVAPISAAEPIAEVPVAVPKPVHVIAAVVPEPIIEARSESPESVAAIAAVKPTSIESLKPVRTRPAKSATKPAIQKSNRKPAKARRRKPKQKTARLPNRSGSSRPGAAGSKRGGAGGRVQASAGAVASYGARVRSRILANRPSVSGQGRVVISFGVSVAGGLRFARIIRSSGSSGLDRAALTAVRRSSPFPKPPAGSSARQLSFSIPFSFR